MYIVTNFRYEFLVYVTKLHEKLDL